MEQGRTNHGAWLGVAVCLNRVSAQGPQSLAEYFINLGAYPHLQAYAEHMVALIRHLEDDVPGPDQWATTSHYWFYLANDDTWLPEMARVFIRGIRLPNESEVLGYEIKYRSVQALDWETSFTILSAWNVEEAGQLVVAALQHAVTDLSPLRGSLPTS